MRAILVEPYLEPKLVKIDDSLESLQSCVGGLIQLVLDDVNRNDNYSIFCNEEGKLLDLEPNRVVTYENDKYDVIYGNLIIVGNDKETGECISLTDEQVKEVMEYFSLENSSLCNDENFDWFLKTIGRYK